MFIMLHPTVSIGMYKKAPSMITCSINFTLFGRLPTKKHWFKM